jgi:heme exporter protein B
MKAAWARLALRDLRIEARGRETALPMLLVGATALTIGLLAFHDHAGGSADVASGLVWLALAFAASVGLGRAFGAERDRGTLDTLLTLPVERGTLYLAKAASAFALLLLVAVLVVPAYFLVEGAAPPAQWPALALLVALGTLGLAATGTVASALAAQTRGRDLLLPVLLFPLVVPLLVATVHGTHDVLHGEPFREWRGEVLLLLGYDLAFLATSVLLIDHALEA